VKALSILFLSCIIVSSCKKEENLILQSDVVSDIIVDSICAQSLGYTGDTVYTVFIPNAFTPDLNGVNDVFLPKGKGDWKEYYFEIRNKNNELIFKTTDFGVAWNGRRTGGDHIEQKGVYHYYVEILTGCPAMIHRYRGGVLLMR
jgi:hypothetical protein